MSLELEEVTHPFVSPALDLGDLNEFNDNALLVSADEGKDVLGQFKDMCVKGRYDLVEAFEPFDEGSSGIRGSLLCLAHGLVSETLQLVDQVVHGKQVGCGAQNISSIFVEHILQLSESCVHLEKVVHELFRPFKITVNHGHLPRESSALARQEFQPHVLTRLI